VFKFFNLIISNGFKFFKTLILYIPPPAFINTHNKYEVKYDVTNSAGGQYAVIITRIQLKLIIFHQLMIVLCKW